MVCKNKLFQVSRMADIRSSITCPKLVELYDHWNRIRGIRNVPNRSDFDPIDIPKLLPYIIGQAPQARGFSRMACRR